MMNEGNSEQSKPMSPSGKVSMHEGVEIWEDICVCEPEPRWQQLAEELERAKQSPKNPTEPGGKHVEEPQSVEKAEEGEISEKS